MGSCCSSSARFDANISLDGFYTSPHRSSMKRNYSSRISNTSSGVFSRCTTPSRHSRRTSTTTSDSPPLPSKKKYSKKASSLAEHFGILSIIDDFAEAQQQAQAELDKSCGYFTKSISSSSGGGSKSSLRYTRDTSFESPNSNVSSSRNTSQSYERPDSPTGCDLEMEMLMMTNTKGVIGKTSSPMLQRREAEDATYNFSTAPPRPSASYNRWSKFLHTTPAYIINNVTNIPEAVAGQFCPRDFPAFIDVEIEGNAPKRFKLDTDMEVEVVVHTPASAAAYTSTEL